MPARAKARFAEPATQRESLEEIAGLIRKGMVDPEVIRAAKALTQDCAPRDDLCELEAIFEAVKNGDSRVPWLKRGMRYVADPRSYDTFFGASAMIEECRNGSCAGDCDDQCIMVGSLAAALGFMVGARAWGPGRSGDYVHVYCVAAVPKSGPWPKGYFGHGLDTTVASSYVGWEPGGGAEGHIMTSWVNE